MRSEYQPDELFALSGIQHLSLPMRERGLKLKILMEGR